MINYFSRLFGTRVQQTQVETDIRENETCLPYFVFIHGANQSRVCWNYIISELNIKEYTCLEYDTHAGFYNNLEALKLKWDNIRKPFVLVTHSLGGIYGLHLYNHSSKFVTQSISISTPFGGSKTADYVKYMVPSYRLFKEIGTRSEPITDLKTMKIKCPWTQVVTLRGGAPWHGTHNDGVVTVASMTERDDMKYIEIEQNHYEALVCGEVLEIIKKKLDISQ